MDLMASDCSAKEVVMAIEEAVETLGRRLRSGEDEEDDGSEDDAKNLSPVKQLVRSIQAYTSGELFASMDADRC